MWAALLGGRPSSMAATFKHAGANKRKQNEPKRRSSARKIGCRAEMERAYRRRRTPGEGAHPRARLRSAAFGKFGDCEVVGEGVSEMRVHVGLGYRVHFTLAGKPSVSC